MATGWFSDPYGRHEARWISSGSPTALVRDGVVEQSDPVDEIAPPSPGDASAAALAGTADSRRPAARHTQRVGADPSVGTDGGKPPSTRFGLSGRRRQIGVVLIILGLGGVVFGYHLVDRESSQTVHSQSFVPTAAELAVRSTGGTTDPSPCPSSVAQNAPDYELALNAGSANTSFTVYAHSLIGVYQGPYHHQDFSAELSNTVSTCTLQSSAGEAISQTYYLERPGTLFVYYLGDNNAVRVVKIVITAASPPSTLPGWTFFLAGALLLVVGGVLTCRRRPGPPDDLRRADDASRSAQYDSDRYQRAAWDAAIDQTAGQY